MKQTLEETTNQLVERIIIYDKSNNIETPIELKKDEFRVGFVERRHNYRNDFGVDYNILGRDQKTRSLGGQYAITSSMPDLSKDHCMLRRQGKKRYIVDLGSATGTYLNGRRISRKRWKGKKKLQSGDVIGLIPRRKKGYLLPRFDDFVLEFKYEVREK